MSVELEDIILSLSGIKNDTAIHLINEFGSSSNALNSSDEEIIRRAEISPRDLKKIRDNKHLVRAKDIIEQSFKKNIRIISYCNQELYPVLLRQCNDAPLVLYAMGDIERLAASNKCLSVVGTRKHTPYGAMATENIIREISEHHPDSFIVSGLAYGIDAIAHKSALKYNIPTVAVLAHGLDTIYPAHHRGLAIEIYNKGGVLMTEYPIGTAVFKTNFLQRNRIVAGISCATIVCEAPMRSGSLATANMAHGYNRELFAFPGRIYDESFDGNNYLIYNQKATLLRNINDIEYTLGWERSNGEMREDETASLAKEKMLADMSDQEKAVYIVLSDREEHCDEEIAEKCGLSMNELTEILTIMEMNDWVVSLPGRLFVATK